MNNWHYPRQILNKKLRKQSRFNNFKNKAHQPIQISRMMICACTIILSLVLRPSGSFAQSTESDGDGNKSYLPMILSSQETTATTDSATGDPMGTQPDATVNASAACIFPTINVMQPVDGNTLKVSRIAGAHVGLPDQWDMRFDAWFCSPTTTSYKVSAVEIEHLNGATVIHTLTTTPIAPALVAVGEPDALVMVRDDTLYSFPLPTSIRLTFTLTKLDGTKLIDLTRSYLVAEHINPGPLKAYFFPMRQADFPANTYVTQDRHAENNTFQRWAYDLGAEQWYGGAWHATKPDADNQPTSGDFKENYFIYDRPIYAMSDGLIIGCNRGGVDNNPEDTVGNVPGGNLLWVRTGNETTLYAHLKQYSIPYSLCPFTDDKEHQLGDPNQNLPSNDQYRIRAGQYLGRTGTSGYSRGGPHLHIHTYMGLPAIWGGSEAGIDADARPLEFVNIQVQEKAAGNINSAHWNSITARKLPPYHTRIRPNACSFNPSAVAGKQEVVNLGVAGSCFLQMTNAMVQAGLRPVYIDVHGTGVSSNSSTVWRPANGTAWALLAGLSAAQLTAARTTWITNKGYRFLQLESYAEGNVVKYAVIFVKGPVGGTQFVQTDMSALLLQVVINTQATLGFVPVNIAAAVAGGVPKYAALFEQKNVDTVVAKAAITTAAYQAEFDTQKNAGRHLAYLDGYEMNGQAYLSAIWYSSLSGNYSALHGQTKTQLATAAAQNLAAGRLTSGVTEYTEGGSLRYAGFWRAATVQAADADLDLQGVEQTELVFVADESAEQAGEIALVVDEATNEETSTGDTSQSFHLFFPLTTKTP